MESEKDHLRSVLVDVVGYLCRNGLTYRQSLRIDGVIGITVDGAVFLVRIDQTIAPCQNVLVGGSVTENRQNVKVKIEQPSPVNIKPPPMRGPTCLISAATAATSTTSNLTRNVNSSKTNINRIKIDNLHKKVLLSQKMKTNRPAHVDVPLILNENDIEEEVVMSSIEIVPQKYCQPQERRQPLMDNCNSNQLPLSLKMEPNNLASSSNDDAMQTDINDQDRNHGNPNLECLEFENQDDGNDESVGHQENQQQSDNDRQQQSRQNDEIVDVDLHNVRRNKQHQQLDENKQASRKSSLLKPYLCQYQDCLRRFVRKHHLIRHQRNYHGKQWGIEEPVHLKCSLCSAKFFKTFTLSRHMNKVHKAVGKN